MAKDSDVDRLIQAVTGGAPRPSQPMMPPGHGIIWPDQGGAPWGAPPFPGGHGGHMMAPEMMQGMPPPHMANDGYMQTHDGF